MTLEPMERERTEYDAHMEKLARARDGDDESDERGRGTTGGACAGP